MIQSGPNILKITNSNVGNEKFNMIFSGVWSATGSKDFSVKSIKYLGLCEGQH